MASGHRETQTGLTTRYDSGICLSFKVLSQQTPYGILRRCCSSTTIIPHAINADTAEWLGHGLLGEDA